MTPSSSMENLREDIHMATLDTHSDREVLTEKDKNINSVNQLQTTPKSQSFTPSIKDALQRMKSFKGIKYIKILET